MSKRPSVLKVVTYIDYGINPISNTLYFLVPSMMDKHKVHTEIGHINLQTLQTIKRWIKDKYVSKWTIK